MCEHLFCRLPELASFAGGLAVFFSPCTLPLIPIYMAYIAGVSLGSLESYSRVNTVRNSILFVFGFSLVFFTFGLVMVNLVHNVFMYSPVRYVSGALIVVFGLHFLGVFRINAMNFVKRLDATTPRAYKFVRSLSPIVLGVGFVSGWTPCASPIIASIGFLAATRIDDALLLLSLFTLGLAVPFVFLALFLEVGLSFVRRVKIYARLIEICSGLFLIFVGILIFLGKMDVFTVFW